MAHARITLNRMYDWIVERLDADAAMPSDAEIAERFRFESPQSARTLLADLADAGRITIRSWEPERVILLGRVRGVAAPAPRPAPAVTKADPALDAGVAKIMAVLTRRAAPVAADPLPDSKQETPVALQTDVRNVTIQARGDLRETIERRAAEQGVALGQVAKTLVEAALASEARLASPDAAAASVGSTNITEITTADLLDEIGHRLSAGSPELLTAAIARAEAAEAREAALAHQLKGLREQLLGLAGVA